MSRKSSWADDTFAAGHPTNPQHEFILTRVELQMIQRIRQCEAGAYVVYLRKTARGMEGVHSFKVVSAETDRLTDVMD